VANSPINIVKPPSPTNATDWRPGYATCAAIEYGRPGAIVGREPFELLNLSLGDGLRIREGSTEDQAALIYFVDEELASHAAADEPSEAFAEAVRQGLVRGAGWIESRRAGAFEQCRAAGLELDVFVGGWIDAAISTASNSLAPEKNPLTLELKVSYFSPTRPGIVIAEGWIERRGRTTCFGEGRLTDQAGQILAKASSTIRLVPRDMASAT